MLHLRPLSHFPSPEGKWLRGQVRWGSNAHLLLIIKKKRNDGYFTESMAKYFKNSFA